MRRGDIICASCTQNALRQAAKKDTSETELEALEEKVERSENKKAAHALIQNKSERKRIARLMATERRIPAVSIWYLRGARLNSVFFSSGSRHERQYFT